MPDELQCPEGGTINFDFGIYRSCKDCPSKETCKQGHIEQAEKYQEQFHFTFFAIEAGFILNRYLTVDEAVLLSYIAFRSQAFGFCNEENVQLCRLVHKKHKQETLPVSEGQMSKIISGLIRKEMLEAEWRPKPRGVGGTSRLLYLSRKAVACMNILRTTELYHWDEKGKLKRG